MCDIQINVSLSSGPPEPLIIDTSFNVVPRIYRVINAGRKGKKRRHRKETADDICMLGCLTKNKKLISKIL